MGKNTKLLFEKQGKNNKKKRGFCPGVRLGESMLGNRFLKTLQKPQEKPQKTRKKKQKLSHFITKMYLRIQNWCDTVSAEMHKYDTILKRQFSLSKCILK